MAYHYGFKLTSSYIVGSALQKCRLEWVQGLGDSCDVTNLISLNSMSLSLRWRKYYLRRQTRLLATFFEIIHCGTNSLIYYDLLVSVFRLIPCSG